MRPLLRRLPALALLLAVGALAACSALGGGGDEDPGTYGGLVQFGFEVQSFIPCDREEGWWVVGPAAPELEAQYVAIAGSGGEPAYARVRGSITGRGEYGHLGAYHREVRVEEVLEVRAGECPRPTGP